MKLFILSALLFTACNSASEGEEFPEKSIQNSSQVYGVENFNFPVLTDKARSITTQWPAFEDFEYDIKAINGANLEKLRGASEQLVIFSDSLPKTIPDTLHTNGILARLTVVRTRAKMLDQLVHRTIVDSAQTALAIREMNASVRNLILQINEKFQKDAIDLQRKDDEEEELKKQKRFLDSVYQAELNDKNQ
ncbi:hypothetical protein [uncultured Altibacter sp.]|uniref:hypothetical protein n=1 Tax=uncultured Altibacter sp. TaxID=2506933 RepID=UPI0030D8AA44